MKHLRRLTLTSLLLILISPNWVDAQVDLPEKEKAVACFDIRYDKIRESEMAKTLNLEDMLDTILKREGSVPFRLEKFIRVSGAVSAPTSIMDMMRLRPTDSLPMNFFVEIEFDDEEATDQMLAGMPTADSIENEGKTYYRAGLPNVMLHRKDSTTLVVGTEDFLFRNNKNVFAEKLKNVWADAGDAPIRVAVDMETRIDFLQEMMDMIKQEAPPMVAPMVDVLDNAESMSLSIDLDQDNFLAFQAIGIDEENANELRGVVDGLLGMAKMASAREIEMMKDDTPATAEVFDALMQSMRATGEGRNVDLVLKKPEGLAEAIVETLGNVRKSAERVVKMNRIRMIALATHNYESAMRKLPFDPEGSQRHESLSWRLSLLPYIESGGLYDQLDLEQAADSEINKSAQSKMPEFFGEEGQMTDIVGIKLDDPPSGFADITDGTSNTIMLIEYPEGKPWMESNDLTIDQVVELMASLEPGESLVAGFYDGSVQMLNAGLDENVLRNLLDPADGEIIDWNR